VTRRAPQKQPTFPQNISTLWIVAENRQTDTQEIRVKSKTLIKRGALERLLRSVRFGRSQCYKNITVLPLTAPADGQLQYRTLGEALATWDIAIAEVSTAGSVTELMVVNRSKRPVLLLDGEELAGARQNRVLNTSILIKELSQTTVPVSSSEQGRWSYDSQVFRESGNVMAYRGRSRKCRSVQQSLAACGVPQSNQEEVWESIAELQFKACCMSGTSAMSDVYRAKEEDLRQCDQVFKPVAEQVGLLAFIGGKPAGLDLVSRSSAYAKLHSELVRSYALEGLLDPSPAPKVASSSGRDASPRRPSLPKHGRFGETPLPRMNQIESLVHPDPAPAGAASPSTLNPQPSTASLAQSFLDEILAAEKREFVSVGYGTDCRYQTDDLVGSALVHNDEVIHAAFFRLNGHAARGRPDRAHPC